MSNRDRDIARRQKTIQVEVDEAERKAIDALSRYKFMMFGYWAGIWVHLNRIEGRKRPSPFTRLVKTAQLMLREYRR